MAGKPLIQPFNESHYQLMQSTCDSCVKTRDLLGRLAAAGLDVSLHQADNERQYAIMSGLKQQFFPERA